MRTAREPFLELGHDEDGGAGAELIAKALSGEKTAPISLACEWELEGGTPNIGQKLPVIDTDAAATARSRSSGSP